jgi:hypothetical protein
MEREIGSEGTNGRLFICFMVMILMNDEELFGRHHACKVNNGCLDQRGSFLDPTF